MNGRVVLVGGSGKIGRALAHVLDADGADVVVLSRDPARARRKGDLGHLVAWSPGRPAELATDLDGAHAVVNLAGVPVGPWPWWIPGRRNAIMRSRIGTTRAIVDAIGRLPVDRRPRVLVSASGTDSYEGRDEMPATEDTPFSGGFLSEVCRAWEEEARRATALGVRVAIVRNGFVLARGAPVLAIYALPFRIRLGGPLGDGRQWMSWIHIDDVVGLFRLAIEDERVAGPINAVSPEPARQAQVAGAIAAALGRRSWLPVPAPLIRLALGEAAVLPLGSRRVVPARAADLAYAFRWTDLRAAIADVLVAR
ncbi:MAG TPA: TIGR01777 family oxidoreductase [Candidatus Limnocylindrales bacterium]|nr:TIGR01777 family oxidoreductase [Candidatus Limnocylindrales bacterium]